LREAVAKRRNAPYRMTGDTDVSHSETLRNGLVVTIRSLKPDDRERIAAAIRGLDAQSVYTRLFSHRTLTDAGLDRIMAVHPEHEIALLATIPKGDDEIVIGSCRAIGSAGQQGARTAEIAFVVEEDYHGLGIASRLLRHLARVARARGFSAFEADVLSENKAMVNVFAKSGLPINKRYEGGTIHVTLALGTSQAPDSG